MKRGLVFVFILMTLLVGFTNAECVDSDGGLNYSTYGEVFTQNNTSPSVIDVCGGDGHYYNSSYVYEGYCTDDGGATAQEHFCPNGCDDGACVTESDEDNENSPQNNQTDSDTEYEEDLNDSEEDEENNSTRNRERGRERQEDEYEFEYENEEMKMKVKQKRNRLRFNIESETGIIEIPEECSLQGSALRCELHGGQRQMMVFAGRSGNVILQSKGVNMSTNVEIYAYNGSLWGDFKNNQTKEIRYLPDEIRERIRGRVTSRIGKEFEIELEEDGDYKVEYRKQAKLFGMFDIQERVRAIVNSESGETVTESSPWWGFLAKDILEAEENSE